MHPENKKRLSIEMDDDLIRRFQSAVPSQSRSEVVRGLIEMFVDRVDRHGAKVIGLVMTREYFPSGEPEE